MIKGVIFDLEGTLVKLPIDYETLYEDIRKELGISRVKPLTRTVERMDAESKEKLFKLWEDAEMKALSSMSINEEGMGLYQQHAGKPIALVTMQGRAVVKEILDQLFLNFAIVITRENDVDRERQIKMAAKVIGLKPQDVLFVGDRDNDEAAATQVGCKFVRVRT
ncbi:HAD family hydrolase [Candidatus Bathyarchaeota archaeon]|nr:HAD family hydrolase [Candidatus Bathyarchaeota archaeon]